MTGGSSSNAVANRAEIFRLVATARRHGDTDAYTGKRRSARVAEGMQLEVTMNPDDPSAAWAVSMHDVSKGGVAFWSKRDVQPYTCIYVREFSSGSNRLWLPARVRHRTVGIRGYLIGAAFGLASPSDGKDGPTSYSPPSVVPPPMLPPGWRGPRR